MLSRMKTIKKYCEIFNVFLVSSWVASNLFLVLSFFMYSLLYLCIVTGIIAFLYSNRFRYNTEAISGTVDCWRIHS